MERIAIISDIHGNIPALEAVLNDINNKNIKRIFCLGDIVGKGPSSDIAFDICYDICEKMIKGNWEELILYSEESSIAKWNRKRLGEKRLLYLSELGNIIEFEIQGINIRLLHASNIGNNYRVHKNDTEKQKKMFINTEFTGYAMNPDVIGYGDIHSSFIARIENKIVFNVGSVGNPLDILKASYAIIEEKDNSNSLDNIDIQIEKIDYDIEKAIEEAKESNMPEMDTYINELRTAKYQRSKN